MHNFMSTVNMKNENLFKLTCLWGECSLSIIKVNKNGVRKCGSHVQYDETTDSTMKEIKNATFLRSAPAKTH